MILERIYETSEKFLRGQRVKEVRIGISLLAIELEDGNIGVSYVLREELPAGCSVMPIKGRLSGMDALEMASFALNEKHPLLKSLGLAVLNAATNYFIKEEDYNTSQNRDNYTVKKGDKVAMIGFIAPIYNRISEVTEDIYVFDRGREGQNNIYKEKEQEEILPKCDVVIITGTTLINDTLEKLLLLCKGCREVVIMGPSTLMYREVFKEMGVTCLAGTMWPKENKEHIFGLISEAGGVKTVGKYGVKMNLRV